jgi:hypothetical protein
MNYFIFKLDIEAFQSTFQTKKDNLLREIKAQKDKACFINIRKYNVILSARL